MVSRVMVVLSVAVELSVAVMVAETLFSLKLDYQAKE